MSWAKDRRIREILVADTASLDRLRATRHSPSPIGSYHQILVALVATTSVRSKGDESIDDSASPISSYLGSLEAAPQNKGCACPGLS